MRKIRQIKNFLKLFFKLTKLNFNWKLLKPITPMGHIFVKIDFMSHMMVSSTLFCVWQNESLFFWQFVFIIAMGFAPKECFVYFYLIHVTMWIWALNLNLLFENNFYFCLLKQKFYLLVKNWLKTSQILLEISDLKNINILSVFYWIWVTFYLNET